MNIDLGLMTRRVVAPVRREIRENPGVRFALHRVAQLSDFHRTKSSVAYHTSGRMSDLTCRESRLRRDRASRA